MSLLTLLPVLALASPGSPRHDLQLSAGMTYLSRTDVHISPQRLSGAIPRAGLAWTWRGEDWTHRVNTALSIGSMRSQPDYAFTWDGTDRTTGPSVVTMVDVQYAAGRRIEALGGSLSLGATSANHLEDLVFVNGFLGTSHYLGALELGPWLDWKRELGERHAVGVEAWVPVAAWLGRNPYAVHSGQHIWNTRHNNVPSTVVAHIADGSLRTWNTYQALHTRARGSVALHDHWTAQLGVRVDWLHYAIPAPVVELQAGADLSLHGRF